MILKKILNNAVFEKVTTDIKLVTTEKGRNYLVSEPNNHSTKFFKENFIVVEMEKKKYIYIYIHE